jgi:hypothetical protein
MVGGCYQATTGADIEDFMWAAVVRYIKYIDPSNGYSFLYLRVTSVE